MFLIKTLQKQVEVNSRKKFLLKINDNRSTMLSVRWEPHCTKVSMHRMFLEAPKNVMEALACYLLRRDKVIAPAIKAYIDYNLKKLDYTHLLDRKNLETQGKVYNLKKIYDRLNDEYFHGALKLSITWFGRKTLKKNRSRVTFGLYHDPLKLIKIHKMMDDTAFPDYVVHYVIFHEMLHFVCPSYVDENGIHRIHSKEFKQNERKFKDYEKAKAWIRNNRQLFFAPIK